MAGFLFVMLDNFFWGVSDLAVNVNGFLASDLAEAAVEPNLKLAALTLVTTLPLVDLGDFRFDADVREAIFGGTTFLVETLMVGLADFSFSPGVKAAMRSFFLLR